MVIGGCAVNCALYLAFTNSNLVRYNNTVMKDWLPDNVKTLRRALGLSQGAFGGQIGVSGNYIYLLEKGVKTPSETLKLLLDCVEEKANRKEVI